jgi:hypothetical protein
MHGLSPAAVSINDGQQSLVPPSALWTFPGRSFAARPLDPVSCHRFRANEVRLLLGVIAYSLGNLLRRLVLPVAIRDWSLTSLQQRLLKTGGTPGASPCSSPKTT